MSGFVQYFSGDSDSERDPIITADHGVLQILDFGC